MSFQQLLSPEHYETLVKLTHNDALVAAWYSAIINPLFEIQQDANALMWLVHLLAESRNDYFKRLGQDTQNRSFTMVTLKDTDFKSNEALIVGDPDRPETCSKMVL